MTFDNIATGSDCVCIDDECKQDTNHVFIRKIGKKRIKNGDLRTHWERDKRPHSGSGCSKECNMKGLTFYRSPEGDSIIDQWRNEGNVTEKYSPKRVAKKHSCWIKFRQDAGLIKLTPSKQSQYHYTFYKRDDFSMDLIEVVRVEAIWDGNVLH